ncbi:SPOR domain-containing protein [Methyloligella halotolerans]|uniref:SPOR domain-containing protein n=1 Tax=Methyloligella halotolerans TaxID=1177755 RepID=UPI00114CE9A7|nr:SPOR domain-containing protein [Methyloligella halotolerans]
MPAYAVSAAVDAGAAELRAGQYQSAVQRLTAALGDESLSSREAALALYYRGLANRKLGRHAQAIADLGNGIFLGLPSTDRVAAQVERGYAFRDLGLAEESQRELAYAQKAAPSQTARLSKQGGVDVREVATGTQQVAVGGFWDRMSPFGGTTGTPAKGPPPSQTTTTDPAATEGWSTQVATGDQAVPATPPARTAAPAPVPQAAPAPAPAPQPEQGGNAITRWFGSWGNSYAEPPAETASTSEGGGYRLQLAASRSEAEARQLWQKVQSSNPALSGKTPQIEQADVGDLGTFYRLQIGPFSDKAESEKLCNDLKRSGVECFLVVAR